MIFSWASLAMACIDLLLQSFFVMRLLGNRQRSTLEKIVHWGILRTAISRVASALLYLGVGVMNLMTASHIEAWALATFCVVRALWWLNAGLDIRLRSAIARLEDKG